MSCNTFLQEFVTKPCYFGDRKNLLIKIKEITDILSHYGFICNELIESILKENNRFFLHLANANGSDATLRGYPPNLMTLDIQEYVAKGQSPIIKQKETEAIKNSINKVLLCSRTLNLPAIRRGQDVPVYFPSSSGCIVEYDFDKCVFEADSDYQNIKIMHSQQFGNVLLLDNDINLAESDLRYTHAITGHGRENYVNKSVLVLGGGDGGILHELLKEKPKFITMVDIDRIVVEQAIINLRGICFDSMDQLSGDNYEVLIADCVPILKKYISEKKMFDFVINDLTAVPVSPEPVGDHWDFLRLILDLSMQVLAPTGKYYTQGNGANNVQALEMYEQQLKKLKTPVQFKKETVCVPSYLELWVFYKIWKCENEKEDLT